jgi:hypothetical protein
VFAMEVNSSCGKSMVVIFVTGYHGDALVAMERYWLLLESNISMKSY